MREQNVKLRKQLEIYVNNLDKDIKKLRTDDSNEMRRVLNESDASLIEEIKLDLIKILEGAR